MGLQSTDAHTGEIQPQRVTDDNFAFNYTRNVQLDFTEWFGAIGCVLS